MFKRHLPIIVLLLISIFLIFTPESIAYQHNAGIAALVWASLLARKAYKQEIRKRENRPQEYAENNEV